MIKDFINDEKHYKKNNSTEGINFLTVVGEQTGWTVLH